MRPPVRLVRGPSAGSFGRVRIGCAQGAVLGRVRPALLLGVPAAAAALLVAAPAGAATSSPTAARIDGHVRALAATQARSGDAAADAAAGQADAQVTPGGRILVDVYVRGDLRATVAALRGAGMQVTGSTARAPVPTVEGWLPLEAADDAAALGAVRSVQAVAGIGTDTGGALSQGDAAHRGPGARALGGGITGAGVKVGVISDSIDKVGAGISGSQGTGDLPADVHRSHRRAERRSTKAGRWPRSSTTPRPGITTMVFASGTATRSRRQGRGDRQPRRRRGEGDRRRHRPALGEPFFQDGVVAAAVDRAQAAGVAYFASAGQPRSAELRGDVHADAGWRPRFRGRGCLPDDLDHPARRLPRRQSPMGRAVGPGRHGSRCVSRHSGRRRPSRRR